jgi:O-acetyl-ADP-ribose deacetylase
VLYLFVYFPESIIMNKIQVLRGDITKMKVDAIVNAANTSLLGGGGVDGAIHRAGGPAILEACRKIIANQGGCKTGEAVITTAGNLPANYVIHTVGPVWNDGTNREKEKLASCYKNSLQLAIDNKCKTIAFPNISTGIYRFPKEEAAKISIDTIKEFLSGNDTIEKVFLVCFDEENYKYVKKEAGDF